jgi:ABC-2 type transport system ATP-binding protein
VEDFTLEIPLGEVFGLAGPNGAGKSTLIALMLGYLRPSAGVLRIGGLAPRDYVEQHGIGYLSELVHIPPRWKLEHALERYALLAGLPVGSIAARVEELIVLLDLGEHRGKQVRQLSKGNLQRLGLAQALLHDEQVLVLDEPTHGLDPVWTQRFRELVNELRRPDRVIFIASHNLDELQRVADRVGIADHGRLQRIVETGTITAASATPYRLVVARGAEHVLLVFANARERAPGQFDLPAMELAEINDGLARLIAAGVLVSAIAPAHSALEQQFREAVAGGSAAARTRGES